MFERSFPQSARPTCGIFRPNSAYVAHYSVLIRTKSSTNRDVHLAESLFQTCSGDVYDIIIS
ncbi:DUF6783 domain-containing protein [Ruminococcus sp. 1001136sp1]|uniref:DUF6783 domain-containing protein n=1 Tax=Ruminococcus sp. 1001136sp1 TaxID=2986996 RepID=UPI003FA772F2